MRETPFEILDAVEFFLEHGMPPHVITVDEAIDIFMKMSIASSTVITCGGIPCSRKNSTASRISNGVSLMSSTALAVLMAVRVVIALAVVWSPFASARFHCSLISFANVRSFPSLLLSGVPSFLSPKQALNP